jgi:hypothetical protein
LENIPLRYGNPNSSVDFLISIMNKFWWIIIVIILFLGVGRIVSPLFGWKYIPTHDGEYHIIRIVEFSRMLNEGYLIPRWAPTLNSGYGIPIFNFHYPFPNFIGSLLRNFFTHDAVYAFQSSMGVGYLLIVLSVFLWLLSIFGVIPALIGAIVACSVPYLLVDIYIRGSIGEIWAFVFFFIILNCIERQKNWLVSFCYGLLIISHNIMGMIFTPFLFFYAFVRNKQSLIWFLGGLGISAFFWIPALFEQKYVVGLNIVNFKEHFVHLYELFIPSWGSGFSGYDTIGNKMSLQIGIIPLMWIIVSTFFYKNIKEKSIRILYIGMISVFVIIVFCMTKLSIPIWELVKPMQFIQYPWRLLSFMIPICAFISAEVAQLVKRTWLLSVLACLSFLLILRYTPVLYEPRNEAYYMARNNFTDGTSSMGNSFSTIWTSWKDTRAKQEIVVEKGFVVSVSKWKYLEKSFSVRQFEDGLVSVNTIYFPGWTVFVDDIQIPLNIDKKGIIEFSVPRGVHKIDITFQDTIPRKVGNYLSIISLVSSSIVGIFIAFRNKHKVQ